MGGKLSYPAQDVPEDRTFIVTGGNSGIGYQTSKCIAKLGGRVVIACRSEERAKEAIEKMQAEHQEEVKKKRADDKAAAAKAAAAEKAAADKAAAAEKAAAAKKAAAEKAAADKAAAAEKAAADKAAAAEKAAADKAAAAEKADEDKDAAKAADKPEASKEDAAKEEAVKEDGPKEDGPKEEPAKDNGAKEEAVKTEETSGTEEAAKQTEETSKDAEEKPAAAEANSPSEGETTEAEKEAEKEEEPEEPIAPLKLEFMPLDLETFASTMEFVNAYKAKGYPLHVLICNAGFGGGPQKKTDDGYELHFQVNYLSHFLMTLHLLPLLRESAPNSRIVNVSSTVHTSGVFNLNNMNGEQSYDRAKFYGNSKLYQIMSMYALERRLKETEISVFSVHPGYVDSEFNKGNADHKLFSFVDSLAGTFRMKRSVQDGATSSLVAALDASFDGKSALYFKNCKPTSPSGLARKVEQQEALWKYSVECLKDHVTDELLKDLQLPEPEPTGETKPEEEATAKPEGEAAAGAGGDASAAGGDDKGQEVKDVAPGGDAEEKKDKEEEKEEEEKKEEEKKDETKEGAQKGGE